MDRSDRHHISCRTLLETHPGPLIVPHLVIGEVSYLVESRLGTAVEFQFLRDLAAGHFLVEPVLPGDWPRIAELVWRYRDLPLGTVDASIMATAERLNIQEIATLDRRHFAVVRPDGLDAFTLLPHSV